MSTLNLSTLLLNNLNDINISINLSSDEINYIKHLINDNSDIINIIQDDINNIIKDGKIDYTDIPLIISLLSDIFKNHIIENKIKSVGIINIIKFILDSILNSRTLPIPENELEIFKNIINTSLDLLQKNIHIITELTCFRSIMDSFKKYIPVICTKV